MNAREPHSSVFRTDEQVIDEIARIFPQADVERLRDQLLQDDVYHITYAANLDLLKERFRTVGFTVRDVNVAPIFDSFRKSVNELDELLSLQFGLDPRKGVFSIHAERKMLDDYQSLKEKIRNAYGKFHRYYMDLLASSSTAPEGAPISLGSYQIRYSEKEGAIYFGTKICQLPPNSNLRDFCSIMFAAPARSSVDWSEVAEKMLGHDPMDKQKRLKKSLSKIERTVRDTLYRANERVQKSFATNDKLFTWERKSISRNF